MSQAHDICLAVDELLAECREMFRQAEPPKPEQLYKLPFASGYVVIGQRTRDMLMYLKSVVHKETAEKG